jgi:hypothetical protein
LSFIPLPFLSRCTCTQLCLCSWRAYCLASLSLRLHALLLSPGLLVRTGRTSPARRYAAHWKYHGTTKSNSEETITLYLVNLPATKQPSKGSIFLNIGGPGLSQRNALLRDDGMLFQLYVQPLFTTLNILTVAALPWASTTS